MTLECEEAIIITEEGIVEEAINLKTENSSSESYKEDALEHASWMQPLFRNIFNKEWNKLAPQGYIWKCLHCGRVAEWKSGIPAVYPSTGVLRYGGASRGYDASCMVNAILVKRSTIENRVLSKMNAISSNLFSLF
jgi:hypothetical protein